LLQEAIKDDATQIYLSAIQLFKALYENLKDDETVVIFNSY